MRPVIVKKPRAEQDLEDYFTRTSIDRNLVYRSEYQQKAQVFELTTGYALHVPSTAPHWVRNEEAVGAGARPISPKSGKAPRRNHRNPSASRPGLRSTHEPQRM